MHVLDAMQNSVEAGASRLDLRIEEDLEQDRMMIELTDDGRGMDRGLKEKVMDPFVTTRKTRHIGLGLPLFAAAARRCRGDLKIDSEQGKGTRLVAWFQHSHWDRAPLGDMPSALLAILLSGRPIDILYTHRVGNREFCFDSAEVRGELGEVPLSSPRVRSWILASLQEGERGLMGFGADHGT